MEKIYAFTDESGSFGWELDNENTSTHFIITAIIVRESDVDAVRTAVADIRDRYFPNGEIKSSKSKGAIKSVVKRLLKKHYRFHTRFFLLLSRKNS